MNVIFKKDTNNKIFAYYPKKYFISESNKKSFYASTLDFLKGVSVTEEYINICVDATEEESNELKNLIIKENIKYTW